MANLNSKKTCRKNKDTLPVSCKWGGRTTLRDKNYIQTASGVESRREF